MAETYNPRLFIADYVLPALSVWHQTALPTDTLTIPRGNSGGWAERGFSTDTPAIEPDRNAFKIETDGW